MGILRVEIDPKQLRRERGNTSLPPFRNDRLSALVSYRQFLDEEFPELLLAAISSFSNARPQDRALPFQYGQKWRREVVYGRLGCGPCLKHPSR